MKHFKKHTAHHVAMMWQSKSKGIVKFTTPLVLKGGKK